MKRSSIPLSVVVMFALWFGIAVSPARALADANSPRSCVVLVPVAGSTHGDEQIENHCGTQFTVILCGYNQSQNEPPECGPAYFIKPNALGTGMVLGGGHGLLYVCPATQLPTDKLGHQISADLPRSAQGDGVEYVCQNTVSGAKRGAHT